MKKLSSSEIFCISVLLCAVAAIASAHAQSETVLYSFCVQTGCTDGASPLFTTPILGANGNLYGTTQFGGRGSSFGTVFKLTPSGHETILHRFGKGTDGEYPYAGVVMDEKGNLYGTTQQGGAPNAGTVFKVTPSGKETILYSFKSNGTGGEYPWAGVAIWKGNLYGTTHGGGAYGSGTVFKLTPTEAGWTETILHSFGNGTDGAYPVAGLILDKKGNLYGMTPAGGAYVCGSEGCGTVFKLTPSGTETILYNFENNGTDGNTPWAGLVMDAKGNLYGTTQEGGVYGIGTVFKLTPSRSETILYSFGATGTDGFFPQAGLVLDTQGNLYGATPAGGAYNLGTVFKLTPSGTETILHSFEDNGTDGYAPNGGLVRDNTGNLYGMTTGGGDGGDNGKGKGTVYRVTP
jgi:uncharacterized repeat protein (TIGR03803 family)